MTNWKLVLGFVWAGPITFFGFLFMICPGWLLGWYSFVGRRDVAWIWHLSPTTTKLSQLFLNGRNGVTVGNVVLMRKLPEEDKYSLMTLQHELVHVKQCMILGLFQPLVYGLVWISGSILKKTMGHVDGYYDNIFEIHGRRCAGQVVDIVGTVEKLQDGKTK